MDIATTVSKTQRKILLNLASRFKESLYIIRTLSPRAFNKNIFFCLISSMFQADEPKIKIFNCTTTKPQLQTKYK